MKLINVVKALFGLMFLLSVSCSRNHPARVTEDFNKDWKFYLGAIDSANNKDFNDSDWRLLNLPHDWSIEGEFSIEHPATPGGGALPGGLGWYRKKFMLDDQYEGKQVFVHFDGVYMNSEVWINGHYLGKRPNGYISFRYNISPYINIGKENTIAVKVDNSQQPNSRWYSGSGIYRNVKLISTDKLYVDQWGTYITTPEIDENKAIVDIEVAIVNSYETDNDIEVVHSVIGADGAPVAKIKDNVTLAARERLVKKMQVEITTPELWSPDNPYVYTVHTDLFLEGKVVDDYNTTVGIRYFDFDSEKGFSINGKPTKILGVCNHHDLGCLGTAINERALERQLEILKEMGCNAIRTAHNPPAPELLDLCDKMGFLVMDEVFDMWKKSKSPYDYHLYWDEWHEKDLRDFMQRDRNHPSIVVWSIGNEILEQWDTSGQRMVTELYNLAREMDTTRPITTANNPPNKGNNLNIPMVLDLVGYNYAHGNYVDFPNEFPGEKFIATETTSALATRGYYEMPSDSIRRWPYAWDKPFTDGNPDNTVSAYDHVSTPWGSTHEETWKLMKKHDFLSGMFIWTGFDYLGEPTPYSWPSRSSYFGIIDLAGFPKDVYYMYQSEWTDQPVLHIFPHWNWTEGQDVDVWAYSNYDEVELFLNGESLGVKRKENDDLHLMWRVKYVPGTIKAIARSEGKSELVKEVITASDAATMELMADRYFILADGKDLSFITVEVNDENGQIVPNADNLIHFNIEGPGKIVGVDNGDPTSHEAFKAEQRKAFKGKCLVVVQSEMEAGEITLTASSDGLKANKIVIVTQ